MFPTNKRIINDYQLAETIDNLEKKLCALNYRQIVLAASKLRCLHQ